MEETGDKLQEPGTEVEGTGEEGGVRGLLKEGVWLRVKEMEESLQLKEDEVVVRLLADLQDLQDREVSVICDSNLLCPPLPCARLGKYIISLINSVPPEDIMKCKTK